MVTAGQGGVQSQILEVMRMLLECETTERVYIPQRLIVLFHTCLMIFTSRLELAYSHIIFKQKPSVAFHL